MMWCVFKVFLRCLFLEKKREKDDCHSHCFIGEKEGGGIFLGVKIEKYNGKKRNKQKGVCY